MIDPVVDAVTRAEFLHGLRAGGLASAAAILCGVAASLARRRRVAPPFGGVLLAAAAVFGLDQASLLPNGLAVAIVVLAIGGIVVDVFRLPTSAFLVTAAPGALLLAERTAPVAADWIRPFIAVAVPVITATSCSFDRRWRACGGALPLAALTIGGIYVTVPDTEQALVLLGAALVAAVAWPLRIAAFGGGGAALVGLAAWVIAVGGLGRESAVVGAIAGFGLLVVEPVAVLLRRSCTGLSTLRAWGFAAMPAVGAVHAALVLVATRVAGLQPTLRPAVALSTALLTVSIAVLAASRRRQTVSC